MTTFNIYVSGTTSKLFMKHIIYVLISYIKFFSNKLWFSLSCVSFVKKHFVLNSYIDLVETHVVY